MSGRCVNDVLGGPWRNRTTDTRISILVLPAAPYPLGSHEMTICGLVILNEYPWRAKYAYRGTHGYFEAKYGGEVMLPQPDRPVVSY